MCSMVIDDDEFDASLSGARSIAKRPIAKGGMASRASSMHRSTRVCVANARCASRRAHRSVVKMMSSSSSSSSSSATPSALSTPRKKSIAVVTGANTGIGYETVKALLASGAYDEIVLACRDERKARDAAARLSVEAANANANDDGTTTTTTTTTKLTVEALELACLDSVRACADALNARAANSGIDALILNAGVMAVPNFVPTTDGFELQVGVCHLGHYALTARVMPALERAAAQRGEARVVTVSSEAHRIATKGVSRDDFFGRRAYSAWGQYGQAKLANVLFAFELARRCARKNNGVTSSVLHPGAVDTELGRYLQPEDGDVKWWQKALYDFIRTNFLKTPAQGAETSVFLAHGVADGASTSGKYYADCKEKAVAKPALSETDAEWLWARSAELTGATFDSL